MTAVAALLLHTACSEKFNIDRPSPVNLSVSLEDPMRYDEETDTYIVRKEQPVSFVFDGDRVDNILFYSGELGYEYRYRHREIADEEVRYLLMQQPFFHNDIPIGCREDRLFSGKMEVFFLKICILSLKSLGFSLCKGPCLSWRESPSFRQKKGEPSESSPFLVQQILYWSRPAAWTTAL